MLFLYDYLQLLSNYLPFNCSIMKTNAPTQLTVIISSVLAAIALIALLLAKAGTIIPFVTVNAFWILLVGFCLLLAGCFLKKL